MVSEEIAEIVDRLSGPDLGLMQVLAKAEADRLNVSKIDTPEGRTVLEVREGIKPTYRSFVIQNDTVLAIKEYMLGDDGPLHRVAIRSEGTHYFWTSPHQDHEHVLIGGGDELPNHYILANGLYRTAFYDTLAASNEPTIIFDATGSQKVLSNPLDDNVLDLRKNVTERDLQYSVRHTETEVVATEFNPRTGKTISIHYPASLTRDECNQVSRLLKTRTEWLSLESGLNGKPLVTVEMS